MIAQDYNIGGPSYGDFTWEGSTLNIMGNFTAKEF